MNTEQIKTEYLGDGVYANVGEYPGEIILTTGCHIAREGESQKDIGIPGNGIHLDPYTARSLFRYLAMVFCKPGSIADIEIQ